MEKRKKLVLFDFDGTLTDGDTMIPFMSFAVGPGRLRRAVLKALPAMAAALFKGSAGRVRAKQALFSACFKGMAYEEFVAKAGDFGQVYGVWFLRLRTLAKLREALNDPEVEVAVVSASMSEWIEPVLRSIVKGKMPRMITTVPQCSEEGVLSGMFESPNCKGKEKVRRIRQEFGDISGLYVTAYGDSKGDRAMLALADRAVWVGRKSAWGKVRSLLDLLKYVK